MALTGAPGSMPAAFQLTAAPTWRTASGVAITPAAPRPSLGAPEVPPAGALVPVPFGDPTAPGVAVAPGRVACCSAAAGTAGGHDGSAPLSAGSGSGVHG